MPEDTGYDVVSEKQYVLTRELFPEEESLLRFAACLVRHAPYVITRGSVEILMKENIRVFWLVLPGIEEEAFGNLFDDLQAGGFWCVGGEDEHMAFSLLTDGLSVRFAPQGEIEPEFLLMFGSTPDDEDALKNRVQLATKQGMLFIHPLIRQGPSIDDDENEEGL